MKQCFLLLSFTLAVAGCMPAYIEELDASAPLTRQMTAVGTTGPVNMQTNGTSIRFFPLKPTATSLAGMNMQSGFTVSEETGYDYMRFAFVDPSGQTQVTPTQTFPLSVTPSAYPQLEFDVAATTTTGNIVVVNFDPGTLTAYLYPVTLPYGGFAGSGLSALSSIISGYTAVGDQLVPSQGTEAFYFLFWTGSSFAEGKAGVGTGSAAFSTASPGTTGIALPTSLSTRALYGTCSLTGYSYASAFNGSQWVCYQWTTTTAASPVQLPGMTHRLDAVLTTGDLLSTEGGVLRLYDPSGNLLVSVSLGGLQYCYEAYIGSTPYVFFSLSMNLSRGDWAFRTYAIPTSSMRGLGG